MADLFESYASDFTSLTSSIAQRLSSSQNESGEARKSSLRRAEMEVEEADEVLGQMDIELQSFPQSIKSRYALKVREARGDLDKLKREIVSQGHATDVLLEPLPLLTHTTPRRKPHCPPPRLLGGVATMPRSRTMAATSSLAWTRLRSASGCSRVPRGSRTAAGG